MFANLLKHQAMWCSSSLFGIAHHSANSSRVLTSGRRSSIIHLIGALVRGISLSRHCFAGLAFSSQYWNTSFRAFVCTIWKAASWWFDCLYTCSRSIIALSGSSQLAFKRLPSWRIWSEMWLRRCIFTKLRSSSSRRCFTLTDSICIISSSTRRHVADAERLFQAVSLSHCSCLSAVHHVSMASGTIFVDLPVRKRLKTSFWQWICGR